MTEAGLLTESVDAKASAGGSPPPAQPQSRWRGLLEIALLACLFTSVIVGWAWWTTGSYSLVWPYLQGQRLLFDPLEVVINDASPGSTIERSVRVVNLTGTKVTLLGSRQSCGCITLDEFPIEIENGDLYQVKLRFIIPPESGEFEHL